MRGVKRPPAITADGQNRVQKWMRVEMWPAPVGAPYQPIEDIFVKSKHRNRLSATYRPTVAARQRWSVAQK
ncbi:hypothetical protein ACSHT2_03890 [Bradyrhizobium sp. PUT101]|uniref:hypothetical protein n=1 Tax=Bradyrhizobium sp. PUT101 TaxID=3447427 RepID=UPI003F85269D